MTDITQPAATTVDQLGVAMFTVSDQDDAIRFYTETLGWELRGDDRFGEDDEARWVEVAPPGSTARLALNPPMGDTPGGSMIGVETPNAAAEHARLSAVPGLEVQPLSDIPGAPRMFSLRDPDGNGIWVVERSA